MVSTVGNTPLAAVFVGTGLVLLLASVPLARFAARRWPTRLGPGRAYPYLRDTWAATGAAMAISQALFYFGQGIAAMLVLVLLLVFLVVRTGRARPGR